MVLPTTSKNDKPLKPEAMDESEKVMKNTPSCQTGSASANTPTSITSQSTPRNNDTR